MSIAILLAALSIATPLEKPPVAAQPPAGMTDLLRVVDTPGTRARARDAIRDPDVMTRRAAVWVLARQAAAFADEITATLLDAALDGDAIVREWSARGLCTLVPTADIVQRVGFLLQDEDSGVRAQAVHCVSAYGKAAGRLAPFLVREIGDYTSGPATSALIAIGAEARPVVREQVRRGSLAAAHACTVLDPAEDLETLTAGLHAQKHYQRTAAAECIGQLGPAAVASAQQLVGLLADQEGWVAGTAARALVRLGRGALPIVAAALASATPEARIHLERVARELSSSP